ncbi:MAG: nicotinamide mononucleotide transporter family protein [Prevotellaceae bacterium]|jgi:nicotinamide riboside transporter PnuC|nr:nicotinamide mononucleotide transporter family protein [Prevotellaceae bacterium]
MNFTVTAIKNLCISVFLTAALMLAMFLFKVEIEFNNAVIFSILATISGVTYLLIIRDPKNYTGFYFGIISSACLGIQFAILKSFDLTFLYYFIFIPFQYAAIVNWRKSKNAENQVFNPQFLPFGRQIFFFSIFVLIVVLDYVFASFCLPNFKNEPFFGQFLIKTVFAIMISSSILANYLMIGKKLDTWLYWLLYSASAIVSAVIINNHFNLLLFIFFLIINALSFVSWLKIRKN